MNAFTREPSQRFKEVFGGESLAHVLVHWINASYMSEEKFGEGFDSKLQKDACIVYDEFIEDLKFRNMEDEENKEKWSKWLERPRNKWGDSPLEKALTNIFIPFLAVT